MRLAVLTRTESTDAGTFGTLETDSGFTCRTGELPWRENQPNRSCIPPGEYECTWRHSPRHGDCYHIEDVPDRTDIEIHAANYVGDESKGFHCELKGCIAPGTDVGEMLGQRALIFSRAALTGLEQDLEEAPFKLIIRDGIQLPPYDFQ